MAVERPAAGIPAISAEETMPAAGHAEETMAAAAQASGDARTAPAWQIQAGRREERLGAAAAAATAVLFGSSYVATAVALRSFTPLATAGWRGLLASLAVAAALATGALGPRPARPTLGQVARLAVLALVGGPVFIVAMNVAVDHAGATITSFVAGLYAVLAAALAPLVLRERLSRTAAAGFVLALAGTALLAQLRLSGSAVEGIGTGLLAALSYALFLVLSRRWSVPWALPGSLITLAMALGTGVPIAAWLVLSDPAALVPPVIRPDAAAALVWLGVAPGAIAPVLLVAAVRRLDARRSSAYLLLNPVSAALLSPVVLGEWLQPDQLLGGLLVLAGIAAASGAVGSRADGRSSRFGPPNDALGGGALHEQREQHHPEGDLLE
ncbi:MAG: DMT family transporter [Candidatus Limnocylindrales bacterium]